MRTVAWLLLLLFVGCCLGLGCGGADPAQSSPLPGKADLNRFPKREKQRR